MKRSLLMLLLAVVAASMTLDARHLWRVEGNGLAKPSYLFGTHHIAPVSILDTTPGLADALAGVDKAYGELDMLHGAEAEVQMSMARLAMAPADSTLSKVMSAEHLARLGEVLSELAGQPVPVAQFDPVKPAVVSMQLAVLQSIAAFPEYDYTKQLDSELLKRAAAAGAETAGLETPEFQIQLLFGTPISEQAADLAKCLDNSDKAVGKARELAGGYLDGDLEAMEAIITDPEFGMTHAEAERMIYSRNDSWVKTLLAVIPTASVLVVVGAGHLPGPRGLIEQLRSHGYTVTPVNE